jgi:hypothetical protein
LRRWIRHRWAEQPVRAALDASDEHGLLPEGGPRHRRELDQPRQAGRGADGDLRGASRGAARSRAPAWRTRTAMACRISCSSSMCRARA